MMMAFVATALFMVTACDKSDDDGDGGNSNNNTNTLVTLTAPPYKDVAVVLYLQSNAEAITQLRIMESGAYMIARAYMLTREAGLDYSTRAGGNELYEFGKFTYSDGKFVFDNGMTISLEPSGSGYEITITWKNGTSIKTIGTIDTSGSVTAGVITDNLCSRAWTIEKVQARAKAPGSTVQLGKDFYGPIDLAKVKAWYEENFGTLKDQFDANTIIQGIFFDSKGLFAINYQNRKDDVGVWRWSDMDGGKLIYNWNDKLQAISLFTGNASVAFEKNPDRCQLTLSGNVNGIDFDFVFFLK